MAKVGHPRVVRPPHHTEATAPLLPLEHIAIELHERRWDGSRFGEAFHFLQQQLQFLNLELRLGETLGVFLDARASTEAVPGHELLLEQAPQDWQLA